MDGSTALTLGDFERAARAELDPGIWAYISGGAGSDATVRANVAAYEGLWLRPRVPTTPCTAPDLRLTMFGRELSMPVVLAPTSPQRLVHEDAELATTRSATAAGIAAIVSADSHYAFPVVCSAAAGADCWFQLYGYRSLDDVAGAIEMAQTAGASALVVTVDAHHAARRITAQRAGFKTPATVDFGTLRLLGILDGKVPANARLDRLPLTWDDLALIRERTTIPLLVKGILHPADARRCVDSGADGVVVSNHGGRQLDGTVPSIVALPEIAGEIRGECTVLVDGGIRSGVSVIKALALGADAVCIGRPYLWGLALGGESGVTAVLEVLRQELEDTLLQLGLAAACEVTPDTVASSGTAATTTSRPAYEGVLA